MRFFCSALLCLCKHVDQWAGYLCVCVWLFVDIVPTELGLLRLQKRAASVIAVSPCKLYVLNRRSLDEVLQEFPHMRRELEHTAVEVRATEAIVGEGCVCVCVCVACVRVCVYARVCVRACVRACE